MKPSFMPLSDRFQVQWCGAGNVSANSGLPGRKNDRLWFGHCAARDSIWQFDAIWLGPFGCTPQLPQQSAGAGMGSSDARIFP